jgi:predicted acetyltransferase
MDADPTDVRLLDAWQVAEAQTFFRNVWPMYVHEIAGFDTDFYRLGADGRWLPDIAEDWIARQTPIANLRESSGDSSAGPFQRTHVILVGTRPVGFVCVALPPFKYMPPDVDVLLAELFIASPFRARGIASRVVKQLLLRYHGRWRLCAIHDNLRAIRFWRKTLPTLPIVDFDESTDPRDVTFSFSTLAAPSFHTDWADG